MGNIKLVFVPIMAVMFVNPLLAAEDEADKIEPVYTLSSGVDYTRGKFGDAVDSTYLTLPQIATITYGRWSTEWTIPYVIARGPSGVIPGLGVNLAEEEEFPAAAQNSKRTGLGDIIGMLSYQVYGETEETHINLIGKIKFGTANSARGLGTGRNDYAPAIGITEPVEDFTFSEIVGYSFNGSPPNDKLKNTLFAQATVNYGVTQQTNIGFTMAYEDGISPSSPGGGSTQVLTTYVSQEFADDWKVQIDYSRGFSPSSLNYGVGAALIHSF